MDVKKAIEQAKLRNIEAKKRFSAKQTSRPASVSGIVQFFREMSEIHNFGSIPPITKENSQKINGFITFLRNNGLEDTEIYEFIEKCIKNWTILQNIQIYTDKRKKYTLDTRPNIVDIIYCKTQIFKELNGEDDIDKEFDMLAEWGKL